MTLLDLTPRVVTTPRLTTLPVVIIGAGPIGPSAAANLAERGIDFLVLEAGDEVAASVRRWGHTRLMGRAIRGLRSIGCPARLGVPRTAGRPRHDRPAHPLRHPRHRRHPRRHGSHPHERPQ